MIPMRSRHPDSGPLTDEEGNYRCVFSVKQKSSFTQFEKAEL